MTDATTRLDPVMAKGGKLPSGTRRTWDEKKYIKLVSGKRGGIWLVIIIWNP
jgi:hypothetical protein